MDFFAIFDLLKKWNLYSSIDPSLNSIIHQIDSTVVIYIEILFAHLEKACNSVFTTFMLFTAYQCWLVSIISIDTKHIALALHFYPISKTYELKDKMKCLGKKHERASRL